MQEKRTLYLAGKITGDPYYFTKFYNAQKKLEEGGFIVVNPALLPAEGFTWEAYPVETTFAYYRLIELSATGTLDDPIPYPETAGIVVNVVSGLYYGYKGAVYLAKADMPNCVYPPDTAGLWQWEKVT